MKHAVLSLALFALATPGTAQDPAAAPEKQDLRVLYAGDPDDERTADFGRFLSAHFAKVGVTSYKTVMPANMVDYDVVIFDWGKIFDREKNVLRRPRRKSELPRNYARPTVLIGAPGIRIAEGLGARLDWL